VILGVGPVAATPVVFFALDSQVLHP